MKRIAKLYGFSFYSNIWFKKLKILLSPVKIIFFLKKRLKNTLVSHWCFLILKRIIILTSLLFDKYSLPFVFFEEKYFFKTNSKGFILISGKYMFLIIFLVKFELTVGGHQHKISESKGSFFLDDLL